MFALPLRKAGTKENKDNVVLVLILKKLLKKKRFLWSIIVIFAG
jgi:hypothetical protein